MAAGPIRENGSDCGPTHERPATATVPRELLSGIDTLDMTCKQPAAPGLVAELLELKIAAQENPREAVTFDVGGEYLRVLPKGLSGAWPVALQHRNGIVGVGESSNMPAWRISPSAEALHLLGPSGVVGFFTSLLESLTGGPVVLLASRLDTHADIAGLVIGAGDVANFVCEADTYAQWCKGDAVQTHWWGPGGVVSARGYDKLAEVAKTGKGGYLLELWGDAVRPGEPITRVEAQVRRRALREMNIVTAQDAIARAGQVWVYITGKWLRWAVPEVRTRLTNAPVDERWQVSRRPRRGASDRPRNVLAPSVPPGRCRAVGVLFPTCPEPRATGPLEAPGQGTQSRLDVEGRSGIGG
jgi:hypothetical protein